MTRNPLRSPGLVLVLSGAAIFLARPAAAQIPTPAPGSIRSIEVSGHGETRATPDLASLDLAVETHGGTAEEAASDNAKLSQKVVTAMKDKLGDKGRIWTGGYNLYPDYEQKPNEGRAKIVGYRAENSINIETSALDQLGSLIDGAITAGANRVNSLNFTLKDQTGPRGDAIGKASKDAQAQAQALSSAIGVKLKRIMNATTMSEARPMPMMRAMAAMADRAPTPVQPGEVTVPATVTLVYEIE